MLGTPAFVVILIMDTPETKNPAIDPLEELRQGLDDPQVLGRIWERHADRLLRVVRLRMDRRLQGRIDPADVLQEAFLDVQARLPEYLHQPDLPVFLWSGNPTLALNVLLLAAVAITATSETARLCRVVRGNPSTANAITPNARG